MIGSCSQRMLNIFLQGVFGDRTVLYILQAHTKIVPENIPRLINENGNSIPLPTLTRMLPAY